MPWCYRSAIGNSVSKVFQCRLLCLALPKYCTEDSQCLVELEKAATCSNPNLRRLCSGCLRWAQADQVLLICCLLQISEELGCSWKWNQVVKSPTTQNGGPGKKESKLLHRHDNASYRDFTPELGHLVLTAVGDWSPSKGSDSCIAVHDFLKSVAKSWCENPPVCQTSFAQRMVTVTSVTPQ